MAASDERPLERLLRAIQAWPWARPDALARAAGLSPTFVHEDGLPELLRQGWIEALTVPTEGSPRWAITSAGSVLLNRPWSARPSAVAWLRAPELERARDLVLELTHPHRLVWSCSPFTLPLSAVYGVNRHRGRARGRSDLPALQPLHLDALWAWATPGNPVRHLTAWLWIDPGDVHLGDALGGMLRCVALWRQHRAWRPAPSLFPVAVIVAANAERQRRVWRLWRETLGGAPVRLRLCARADLARPLVNRLWQTEQGARVGWGGGLGPGAAAEPLAPGTEREAWWGLSRVAPQRPWRQNGGAALAQTLRTWCAWQPRATVGLAGLVALQRVLGPVDRAAVQAIGHYPLLDARDLAVILVRDQEAVTVALRALEGHGLVCPNLAGGYVLTRRGVDWLGAQHGWSGARYARLRRWPGYGVVRSGGYSVAALTAVPAHTSLVKAFFVGLVRHAAAAGLWLEAFDYRNCWLRRPSAAGRRYEEHLIPDGIGRLHDRAGRSVELWLEVDRGTGRGRRLGHKFRRHYLDARGLTRGAHGRLVVVLVENGAERRLQRLARLFRDLDAALSVRLPVRLARVDQLTTTAGLDPTRPVWRDATLLAPGPLIPLPEPL